MPSKYGSDTMLSTSLLVQCLSFLIMYLTQSSTIFKYSLNSDEGSKDCDRLGKISSFQKKCLALWCLYYETGNWYQVEILEDSEGKLMLKKSTAGLQPRGLSYSYLIKQKQKQQKSRKSKIIL